MNSFNGKTSEQRIPHELIIDNKPNNEIQILLKNLITIFQQSVQNYKQIMR